MVIEFSNEQKANLAAKVALCVEFLKQEVQPHLISTDKVSVSVGPNLELIITSKELYVKEARVVLLVLFEPTFTRTIYLEKYEKTKKKKFICDDFPELAVEFLKNWEKAKAYLMKEVAKKVKKVDELNSFIDGFQL